MIDDVAESFRGSSCLEYSGTIVQLGCGVFNHDAFATEKEDYFGHGSKSLYEIILCLRL